MLLKLLFSVNCQTTAAYRAIRSLHFHYLRDRHIVNYIIPLHMWVHRTVRIVGPRHLGFPVPVGLHLPHSVTVELTFLSIVDLRATKIPTSLRTDIPVAIRATKNLENTMLPAF